MIRLLILASATLLGQAAPAQAQVSATPVEPPRASGELKVDLNPPDRRGDVITPHWENWPWREGKVGSLQFGDVAVTFHATRDAVLSPILCKGLLDEMHMGCDGIVASSGGVDMVLHGLTPGKHTLNTYHNEGRAVPPASFSIEVDGVTQIAKFTPSNHAVNDYDVASAVLELQATAEKDVVVHFQPTSTNSGNQSFIMNGFELDAADPHTKAIKPAPANDDEHWPNETPLTWSAPVSAKLHRCYFGSDVLAVTKATSASPEFKGELSGTSYPLPKLDARQNHFWRVDEVDAAGKVTRGEVWRFRVRHLAFPTAEGYGRFALGGRGGRVIEVTNLDDYKPDQPPIPGSFRAAVEAEGPRTIIFRRSGLIKLQAHCAVKNPYCTIAGETAPGDGICLANYACGAYGTHDVIIRYLRVRVGDFAQKAMDGCGLSYCDHCIIDHCSISWSSDEGTSSRQAKHITFQHNIVAEALHHGPHYNGADRTTFETHAFAASISGNIGSYHHNLLAHCTDRNWSLAGGLTQGGQYAGRLDIRNNVVYNWTSRTTDGGVRELNYVNNYYKPYPKNKFAKWLLRLDKLNPAWGKESYYMVGNVMEGFDYEHDNWIAFDNGPEVAQQVRVDQPLFPSYVATQSAREDYQSVLANVGANFPKQDVIDLHILKDVREGTAEYIGTRAATYVGKSGPNLPGMIDTQTDDKSALGSKNFPWPDYETHHVPTDTDHDGIPDDWEIAHDLNPSDGSDANKNFHQESYTNLEKYLHSLVGE